jgi:hypothetical protein
MLEVGFRLLVSRIVRVTDQFRMTGGTQSAIRDTENGGDSQHCVPMSCADMPPNPDLDGKQHNLIQEQYDLSQHRQRKKLEEFPHRFLDFIGGRGLGDPRVRASCGSPELCVWLQLLFLAVLGVAAGVPGKVMVLTGTKRHPVKDEAIKSTTRLRE